MSGKPGYEELEMRVADLEEALAKQEAINRELQATQSRFRLLYENAPLGYQSLDENGRFLEVNRAWLDLLGYSREEVIGKSFGDFLHPDWKDHFKENFPRFKAVGEVMGVEFEIARKDGSYILVSFNGKIGKNVAGDFQQTHCIFNDITEQKRAKQALKDSEEKYRSAYTMMRMLCDNVPDMIWAKDLEKRYLFANEAICRNLLNAADTDEPIGKKDMFFAERERTSHSENPDWHTFGEVCRDTDEITMKAGTPQQFDEQGNVQGKFLFLDVRKAPFLDENGTMIGTVGSARDVTKTKGLEQELKSSEALLRTLVETIPDLVWLKDQNGVYLDCNAMFERFFGAPRKEIVGKTDYDFVDRELADFFREQDRKALKLGRPNTNEEWITFADDGRRVLLDTTKTPMFDIDGELLGVLGIARDITERKRIEEALRESEQSYRTLADSGQALVWTAGTDKLCDYFNRVWLEFTGRTLAQELEMGWLDGVHPDDRQHCEDVYSRAFDRREKFSMVYRLRRYDGKYSWILDDGCPRYNSKGEFIGYIGHCLDITKRKQAEERLFEVNAILQAAMDQSPAGIAIADAPDGKLRYVNDAGLLIRGDGREAIVNGVGVDEYVASWQLMDLDGHPLATDEVPLARAIRFGEVCSREFIIRRAPGDDRIVLANAAPIKDETGTVVAAIVVFNDFTERRRIEEDNAQLKTHLNQAQKMEAIGTLAGGIAHDFNNILGAILGYAEMAHEDCPPASPMAGDLTQIIAAGNRASDLVTQILAFSRQAEAELIPLQPAIIVREILKLLRATLPTTIEIKQDIASTGTHILADPTQIHQILMNICTNAFHAMEETGGMICLSLKKVTLDQPDLADAPHVLPGDFINLSVKDSGPGIPPEIQNKIFDPYFTTKEIGKGTGMGLAIAHGIVMRHGGFIRCLSSPGDGAEFQVFIPVVDEPSSHQSEPAETVTAGSERILFIDDEEILARMTQSMLERLGYHVTVRTSSLEALTTFRNEPEAFDLVITDQTMPGMAGIDLARRILQIRPHLPIILCTGFSAVISEEKARAAGIKGFALKPLAKKDLAVLVRKVLDDARQAF